jgi:hypothetical protein
MKLKTTQKESDLKLEGIKFDIEVRNTTVYSVTFTDATGNLVKVAGSYGLEVCIKAPPKMVEKWKLSGKFDELVDVEEVFDSEYKAKDRLKEFIHRSRLDECGLAVTKIEVPEED